MMPNAHMMQVQVFQQSIQPRYAELPFRIISWTNTSPKGIPMISPTAEAARYSMCMDFLHSHSKLLSNLLALGKAKSQELPRALGKSLANKTWVIAALVLQFPSQQAWRLPRILEKLQSPLWRAAGNSQKPQSQVWSSVHRAQTTQYGSALQITSSLHSFLWTWRSKVLCLSPAKISPCYSQPHTWHSSFGFTHCEDSTYQSEPLIFWDLGRTFLSLSRVSVANTAVSQQSNDTAHKSSALCSQKILQQSHPLGHSWGNDSNIQKHPPFFPEQHWRGDWKVRKNNTLHLYSVRPQCAVSCII